MSLLRTIVRSRGRLVAWQVAGAGGGCRVGENLASRYHVLHRRWLHIYIETQWKPNPNGPVAQHWCQPTYTYT
jgi:hypothetical protein